MSAWAILNAVAGFKMYKDILYFSPKLEREKQKLFLILPTGTFNFIKVEKKIILKQLSGKLKFNKIIIPSSFTAASIIKLNGKVINCNVNVKERNTIILFNSSIELLEDSVLEII